MNGSINIQSPVLKASTPLDTAIYKSLASKLAYLVRMKATKELVYAMTQAYSYDGVRGTQVLITTTEIPKGTKQVTSGSKTATVLFVEDKKVLIKSDYIFDTTDILDTGGKVLEAYNNLRGQAPVFSSFGATSSVSENEGEIKSQIDYKIDGVVLNASKSRKLRARASEEFINDMSNLYNQDAAFLQQKLSELSLYEIMSGIDCEIIKYIHKKAHLEETDPIKIQDMYEGGFYDIPQTLASKIAKAAENISLKTMRPPNIFVVATPAVIKHICAHQSFVPASKEDTERNIFYRGSLFGWDIVSDITKSIENDYLLVGAYSDLEPSMNSIILGIYNTIQTNIAIDSETAETNIFTSVQYDIKLNPLDNETDGASVFLRKYDVVDNADTGVTPPTPAPKPTSLTVTPDTVNVFEGNVSTPITITTDADDFTATELTPKVITFNKESRTINALSAGEGVIEIKAKAYGKLETHKILKAVVTAMPEVELTLDVTSIETLGVGGYKNITATTTGTELVVESSNPSVFTASVVGKVINLTGVAPGNASLTVISKAENHKPKTILIPVKVLAVTDLVVTPETATVSVGNTTTIQVTTDAEFDVISKDQTKATFVKNGNNQIIVTGVAPGVATANVVAEADGKAPNSKNISVTIEAVAVDLTVTPDTLSVKTGTTAELDYTSSADNILVTTSDATIASGAKSATGNKITVTALQKPGTCTLTITAKKQGHLDTIKTVTVTVPEFVSLDIPATTVEVGATSNINVTVTPTDAEWQVTSADTTIATVTKQSATQIQVTGVKAGKTNLKFTATSNTHSNLSKDIEITITAPTTPTTP